ncbi:hypothetical protein V501_09547 [Pseudogymnoascus sp. VKM F-4519 (FW-2642)]|nr:hypothetical protein V501_09547 [Pseudogymnoascus sp. VKM F-4519 (FW-2642)]
MASNNNGKAMPLLGDKGKPAQVKCNKQRWDEIKSDALQIYRDEDKDLKTTMAVIQEIYGFKASIRKWKDKLKEWDCRKNISIQDMQWIVAKGTKRAGEGKDTTFVHSGTRVTTQRIENFKRRKTRGEPASMSTPPNIVYSTPPGPESLPAGLKSPPSDFESLPAGPESLPAGLESPSAGLESLPAGLDSERHSIKEIYEELIEYNAPLSQMPSVSITQPSSVGPLSPKIKHPPATMFDLEELPFMSVIERYLLDEEHPWSIFTLFYQSGDSDFALAKHQERAAQVLGFTDFPKEQNSSPQIRNIGDQFFLKLYSEMCWEQEDEPPEAFALDNSFGLAFTLAEYQDKLKCSVLEIASSAKHMHQVLLEHSTNVDPVHFGSKEAVDHWSYGPFLKKEGRLTSRVEQLLLACESAMNSETHDSQLIAPLKCDFIDLLLGIESDENEAFPLDLDPLPRFEHQLRENDPDAEERIQIPTFDLHQNSPHLDRYWSSERHSRIREYLLSNHRSGNTSSESNPYLTQFELFSGTSNLAEGDRDPFSIGSLIESISHKYGSTYSVSEITGISDSIFMKP